MASTASKPICWSFHAAASAGSDGSDGSEGPAGWAVGATAETEDEEAREAREVREYDERFDSDFASGCGCGCGCVEASRECAGRAADALCAVRPMAGRDSTEGEVPCGSNGARPSTPTDECSREEERGRDDSRSSCRCCTHTHTQVASQITR